MNARILMIIIRYSLVRHHRQPPAEAACGDTHNNRNGAIRRLSCLFFADMHGPFDKIAALKAGMASHASGLLTPLTPSQGVVSKPQAWRSASAQYACVKSSKRSRKSHPRRDLSVYCSCSRVRICNEFCIAIFMLALINNNERWSEDLCKEKKPTHAYRTGHKTQKWYENNEHSKTHTNRHTTLF